MPKKKSQKMILSIEEMGLEGPMELAAAERALTFLVRWAIRKVQNDGETDKRPLGKVVTGESTKGYSHRKRNN